MKVAILSDIHGNNYALAEVLKAASEEGAEKLLFLGDIVGYYYYPGKCLEMLSDWPYEIIKGNHEEILQDLYNHKIDSDAIKKKYGSAHNLALNDLDKETLEWLFNLPIQKSVTIDGVSFQMNHGSPWSIDEYIYPDAPVEKLEKCNSDEHDFVLMGHTHYQFSFQCKKSVLINCGSVGQSRQKGGMANWAMVDTKDKSFEMKATPYDTSELLTEIQKTDPGFDYSFKVLTR